MPLVARVVPDVTGVDKVFDYLIPRELEASIHLGDRVRVPLHGRNVPGWVAHIGETDSGFSDVEFSKLRPVIKRLGYGPSRDVIELAEWASQRWCGRLRSLFVAATPKNLITALPSPRYQRERVAVVGDVTVAAAVAGKHSLLVKTGPVKSPMDVLIAAAKSGPTLVIVPTVVRARLFASSLKRHGFSVAVLPDEWAEAAGGVDIAIGSRTAVFSRIPHLASIVVIDEHDDALKEERTPTWHARDVAIHRSHMLDISCIMMSPLPSIAAVQWANGRILDSPPNERIDEWPTFQIVDRTLDDRWSQSVLSSELIEELRDHSRRIVAIINVKGRARLLACATCKTLCRCESCDAAVEINDDGLFSCPRCLLQRPQVCLKCGAAKFLVLKPGVSKLREDIARAAGRPLHDVSEVTASMDADDSVDQSKMLFVGTEAALHQIGRASCRERV
jgi:primosomal protein N' (replication factor Y)